MKSITVRLFHGVILMFAAAHLMNYASLCLAQSVDEYRGEDAEGRAVIDQRRSVAGARPTRVLSITPSAAIPDGLNLVSVEAGSFPFITVNLRAYSGGSPLVNLPESAFAAYEDGVRQVKYFSVTPPQQGGGVRATDVVFLLDDSGSMSAETQAVRNNVTNFAKSLKDAGVDVQLGLVRFGQDASGGSPQIYNNGQLTSDPEVLKGWLAGFRASGGTEPSVQAVIDAANKFTLRGVAQHHFLVVTDEDSDGGDLATAIRLCQANNIVVHCAIDKNASGNTNQVFVDQNTSMRGKTGGLLFNVTDPFDQLLAQIKSVVSDTYIVKYEAENTVADGKERVGKIIVNSTSFSDDVEYRYTPGSAPRIELTQETQYKISRGVNANSAVDLSFNVTDLIAPDVQKVTLFVRSSGSTSAFTAISAKGTGSGLWTATVPAQTVGNSGFQFYVTATDGDKTTSLPSESPSDNPYVVGTLNTAGFIHYPPSLVRPFADTTIDLLVLLWGPDVQSVLLQYRSPGGTWKTPLCTSKQVSVPVAFYKAVFEVIVSGNDIGQNGIEYYFEIRTTNQTLALGTRDNPFRISPTSNWALLEELKLTREAFADHMQFMARRTADAMGSLAWTKQKHPEDRAWDVVFWTSFVIDVGTVLWDPAKAAKYNKLPPTNVLNKMSQLVNRGNMSGARALVSTAKARSFKLIMKSIGKGSHFLEVYAIDPETLQVMRESFGEMLGEAYGNPDDKNNPGILFETEEKAQGWFYDKIMNNLSVPDADGQVYADGIQGVIDRFETACLAVENDIGAQTSVPQGIAEVVAFLAYQRGAVKAARDSFMLGFHYDSQDSIPLRPMIELGATTSATHALETVLGALEGNKWTGRASQLVTIGLFGAKVVGLFCSGGVAGVIQAAFLFGGLANSAVGTVNSLAELSNELKLGESIRETKDAFIGELSNLTIMSGDTFVTGLNAILSQPDLAPLAKDIKVDIGEVKTSSELQCPNPITTASVCPWLHRTSVTVKNQGTQAVPVHALLQIMSVQSSTLFGSPVYGAPSDAYGESVLLQPSGQSGSEKTFQIEHVSSPLDLGKTEVLGLIFTGIVPHVPKQNGSAVTSGAFDQIVKEMTTEVDLTVGNPVVLSKGQTFRTIYTPTQGTADLLMRFPGSNFDLHVYDAQGKHTGYNYASGAIENLIPGVSVTGASGTVRCVRLTGAAGKSFRIEVYAREADQPESISLTAREYAIESLPGLVSCDPVRVDWDSDFDGTIQDSGATHFDAKLSPKEVGGQKGVSVSVEVGDLKDPNSGATIPADRLGVELASTTLSAGQEASGKLSLLVEPNVGSGYYIGEIRLKGSDQQFPVGVTLRWSPLQLTLDTIGDGQVLPPGGYYKRGATVNIKAVPSAGWRFISWQGDVTDADPNLHVIMDSDKRLTAKFERVQYKLTVTGGSGSGQYDWGTDVPIQATAPSGYRFDKWAGNVADSNSSSTTVKITSDTAVTASFVKQYTLTVVDGTGSGPYDPGKVVTVQATVPASSRFDKWTGPVSDPAKPSTTVTVTGDTTVAAHFVRQHTVTVIGGTGSGTYDEGTEIEIRATVPDGARFSKWVGSAVDPSGRPVDLTIPSMRLSVKADISLTAALVGQVTLVVSIIGPGGVQQTPPGRSVFDANETVSLNAVPIESCDKFVGWQGSVTSTVAQISVTMDTNKEITAVFSDGKLGPGTCCGPGACEVMLVGVGFLLLTRAERRLRGGRCRK